MTSILFLALDYLVFENITDTQITFEGFLHYESCYFHQSLFHLTNYTSSQGDFIRFTNLLSFEFNYLIDPHNGIFFFYYENFFIVNKIDSYCIINQYCALIIFQEIISSGNRALYFESNISFLYNNNTIIEVKS